MGKISLENYKLHLKKIENFINGNTRQIKKELEQEMKQAAHNKKFELAGRLRDQILALKQFEERQDVIFARKVNWDMVSVTKEDLYACINLFKIREGKLLDKENFVYNLPENDSNLAAVMETFLQNYYLEASAIPKEILVQFQITNENVIKNLIFNRFSKKTKVSYPKRGKKLSLIKLGEANAKQYLQKWLSSQATQLDFINKALNQLKDVLKLPVIPKRIEGFDISNLQGTHPVGSMVVFKDGQPAKSEYRKFKINIKTTPDDFAMMREMLTRRFAHLYNSPASGTPSKDSTLLPSPGGEKVSGGRMRGKHFDPSRLSPTLPTPEEGKDDKYFSKRGQGEFWPAPDLIVMDGGKGQLSTALEALRKSEIRNQKSEIPIIGLAKRLEEIFIPGKKDPIILSPDNPALQLLQRLRDEAHRFGVTFHRKLRSKQAVKSVLDEIPGIGRATKKLLKDEFGTVANIKKTTVDELAKVVGPNLAKKIKAYL